MYLWDFIYDGDLGFIEANLYYNELIDLGLTASHLKMSLVSTKIGFCILYPV